MIVIFFQNTLISVWLKNSKKQGLFIENTIGIPKECVVSHFQKNQKIFAEYF